MRAEALLSAGFSRNKIPVWALEGAKQGTTNSIVVYKAKTDSQVYAFVSGLLLDKDDEIEINTANGGGWGRT